jgi:cellulose 1,4-beta-cellobiosidase
MVLVMTIQDDASAHMRWLDSTYPDGVPSTDPGVARGPCNPSGPSSPEDLTNIFPDSLAKFSNIRFGPIGTLVV